MRFHGPVPEVGRRVRHYHPWLEDSAVGTVTRVEDLGDEFRRGPFTFRRVRIYLTDCEHWTGEHTWGSVPDTFFDNMSETWEYEDDAQAGLETAFPARDSASGPGAGA